MPLKARFLILVGLLCTGLGAGLLALHLYELEETNLILEKVRDQRQGVVDRILQITGEYEDKLVFEYAQWSEMVDFVHAEKPNLDWAEINLFTATEVYETEIIWVLRSDGSLFYALDRATFPAPQTPAVPLKEALLKKLRQEKLVHFFCKQDGEVFEVRGGPIVHSIGWEETNETQGYLVVAKRWDGAHLTKLSRLLESQVSIIEPNQPQSPTHDKPYNFHLQRDLPGIDGNPLLTLDIYYKSPELRQLASSDWWEALIFALYGVVAIGTVTFFGYRWVLRPLTRISNSLTTRDAQPLEPLLDEKSELGRVANLVKSAFRDRQELHEALEESARLGRDLHDGVIQTLYASGMSLASIQANMKQNPEAAVAMLEQTRRELNVTIREVRNFINRLEPESDNQQKFEAALRTLLDFMRGGLPVECTVDVDTSIDTELPVDIRAHLLQIVREAASNAFRHSGCTRFHVSLHRTDDGFEFTATDNGQGFDPQHIKNPGQGLKNFHERAEDLSAKLDIESKTGQGAIIRLRIPA